jgi:hypothetical protein
MTPAMMTQSRLTTSVKGWASMAGLFKRRKDKGGRMK